MRITHPKTLTQVPKRSNRELSMNEAAFPDNVVDARELFRKRRAKGRAGGDFAGHAHGPTGRDEAVFCFVPARWTYTTAYDYEAYLPPDLDEEDFEQIAFDEPEDESYRPYPEDDYLEGEDEDAEDEEGEKESSAFPALPPNEAELEEGEFDFGDVDLD